MASLERDATSGHFRIRFRYGGVAYKRSLKTTQLNNAETVLLRVKETIYLLEKGRIEIPSNADPGTFILSDGKRLSKLETPKIRTLSSLFGAYRQSLPAGAKEESTLASEYRHLAHLEKHLVGGLMP